MNTLSGSQFNAVEIVWYIVSEFFARHAHHLVCSVLVLNALANQTIFSVGLVVALFALVYYTYPRIHTGFWLVGMWFMSLDFLLAYVDCLGRFRTRIATCDPGSSGRGP